MLRTVLKLSWIVLLLINEGYGQTGYVPNNCLNCICEVESTHCRTLSPNCHMDGGSLSCGPYQIKSGYFNDAQEYAQWNGYSSLGSWQTCAGSISCSERAVNLYMRRYATSSRLGHTPTCQDFARIHNGGPNGYWRGSTLAYWNRVQNCL